MRALRSSGRAAAWAALFALAAAGPASADFVEPSTIKFADLFGAGKSFTLNEPNPAAAELGVVTITDVQWTQQGDITFTEKGTITGDPNSQSDLIRFINVGGMARIYFGSTDENFMLPPGIPALANPDFTSPLAEGSDFNGMPITARIKEVPVDLGPGLKVEATISLIDLDPAAANSPSDKITLRAVPEPTSLALVAVGAAVLMLGRLRRR